MLLYVATSNPGKLRDFATSSEGRVTLAPLPNLAAIPVPPEDEPTFEANARLKAIAYSLHAPGHILIADDSGLEVDALNGAPGVRSARYAEDLGVPATSAPTLDQRNNLCLLAQLAAVPEGQRQCRYHCVLAAARDGQIIATAHGIVEGKILTAPRGAFGFGYDPLFYLPDHHLTMAEIDPVTRLHLSHRGRALRDLLPKIQATKIPPQ